MSLHSAYVASLSLTFQVVLAGIPENASALTDFLDFFSNLPSLGGYGLANDTSSKGILGVTTAGERMVQLYAQDIQVLLHEMYVQSI